jgi:hypothetical protein
MMTHKELVKTSKKPKRKLCPSEIQSREDYRSLVVVRKAKTENYSTRVTSIEPIKSLRDDWDDSAEDKAKFKEWLSANAANK